MERSLERLEQTHCDLPLQAEVFLGLFLEKAVPCCGCFYVVRPVLNSGQREEEIIPFSPTSAWPPYSQSGYPKYIFGRISPLLENPCWHLFKNSHPHPPVLVPPRSSSAHPGFLPTGHAIF